MKKLTGTILLWAIPMLGMTESTPAPSPKESPSVQAPNTYATPSSQHVVVNEKDHKSATKAKGEQPTSLVDYCREHTC
jgi:hypothetical protein